MQQQDDIRSQIRALIDDPDVKQLELHRTALAANARMSMFVQQRPPQCWICRELLHEEETKQPAVLRSPTQRTSSSSISILPPQLHDVWPRVVECLLHRTAQLRRLLERVQIMLTREDCATAVYRAVWTVLEPAPKWAAVVAAGLRDRHELQLLLEMLFSSFWGCRNVPTPTWHRIMADAAAIRGWRLPAIRVWGNFDGSDGEEEESEGSELVPRLETAGFRTKTLCEPWSNPEINSDTVMVVRPGDLVVEPYR